MPPLINAPPRQRRAQLLGATAHGEAGELAPQRLHFRRSDETKEAAERMFRPFLRNCLPASAVSNSSDKAHADLSPRGTSNCFGPSVDHLQ
jgi:hypothetical protein